VDCGWRHSLEELDEKAKRLIRHFPGGHNPGVRDGFVVCGQLAPGSFLRENKARYWAVLANDTE
jgi:hypothetical protein